jgi:uncharacterized protein (TIGR01244 family)|tara:strand:- start:1489 stop:2046 length:558 start_codon:yes stop_codon:yes gene_type:complete
MKSNITGLILAFTLSVPLFAEVPLMLDSKEYRGGIAKTGNLYIAGQPLNAGALRKLKAEGVTTIINLRTDEEMANRRSTPIDEAKVIADLGLNYIHIPSGGKKHPHSPAILVSFAEALEESEGKVLLHCNSAKRASHLWVAYLVKYKQMSIQEAMAHGRAVNFGKQPIEGYLEGEIEFNYQGQAN